MKEVMQRLITEAYAQIKEQGGPSVQAGTTNCRYSLDGCHCNMWPAIEKYDPTMESRGVLSLTRDFPDFLKSDVKAYLHAKPFVLFMMDLQSAHDVAARRSNFWLHYNDLMGRLAKTYSLVSPVSQVHSLRYSCPQ